VRRCTTRYVAFGSTAEMTTSYSGSTNYSFDVKNIASQMEDVMISDNVIITIQLPFSYILLDIKEII